MLDLKTEFLMTMEAGVEPVSDLGGTPDGPRRIVNISGGYFQGPKLKGKILRNGGDWVMQREGYGARLDVRIVMRTDDGADIYCTYGGILKITPEQLAAAREDAGYDPANYYMRSNPLFHVAAGTYAWLNDVVAIGVGRIILGGVRYDVYQVL